MPSTNAAASPAPKLSVVIRQTAQDAVPPACANSGPLPSSVANAPLVAWQTLGGVPIQPDRTQLTVVSLWTREARCRAAGRPTLCWNVVSDLHPPYTVDAGAQTREDISRTLDQQLSRHGNYCIMPSDVGEQVLLYRASRGVRPGLKFKALHRSEAGWSLEAPEGAKGEWDRVGRRAFASLEALKSALPSGMVEVRSISMDCSQSEAMAHSR